MAMTNRDREDIATMCLAAAMTLDGYLSDSEMMRIEEILRRLEARTEDRLFHNRSFHTVVADALNRMTGDGAPVASIIKKTAERLNTRLSAEQKSMVLADLRDVARADGIILQEERTFIEDLAKLWGVDSPGALAADGGSVASSANWSALHDLALIYLVLAHGTDNELSRNEVQVMLRKLREWQPGVSENTIREVLRDAMDRYAHGPDQKQVRRSIRNVRDAMPEEQRAAALNDLIQIANADGVFLDDEEDLINDLVAEWDVDPYVTYGRHGRK